MTGDAVITLGHEGEAWEQTNRIVKWKHSHSGGDGRKPSLASTPHSGESHLASVEGNHRAVPDGRTCCNDHFCPILPLRAEKMQCITCPILGICGVISNTSLLCCSGEINPPGKVPARKHGRGEWEEKRKICWLRGRKEGGTGNCLQASILPHRRALVGRGVENHLTVETSAFKCGMEESSETYRAFGGR